MLSPDGVSKAFRYRFSVGRMKIIPDLTDIAMMMQHPTALQNDKRIQNLSKTPNVNAKSGAETSELNKGMLEEIKLVRQEAQEEHLMLQDVLKAELNKMHEKDMAQMEMHEADLKKMHETDMAEMNELKKMHAKT
jgi:hypothetical protein